jgi:DNA-binding CsgD family transcriptional regulator
MDIQVALQVNVQNGIDLKQVGASIATQVEGEMVHKILALGLTQVEVAAFFKIDPKTLRAKLRAGQAHASG